MVLFTVTEWERLDMKDKSSFGHVTLKLTADARDRPRYGI